MKKTFYFMLPEVDTFSGQVKAFLPKLSDSELQRYEKEGMQLVEEYIDYHSVIFLSCTGSGTTVDRTGSTNA